MPFDVHEETILTDYIEIHPKKSQQIYQEIQTKIQNENEKQISNINEKRANPETINPNDTVYIKNDQIRNKINPRFFKTKVKQDPDKKVETQRGTFITNE